MFSFNFFPFNAPNDINVDVFGDKNDESFFVSKPEYNIVIIKNNILFKIKMKQNEFNLNNLKIILFLDRLFYVFYQGIIPYFLFSYNYYYQLC